MNNNPPSYEQKTITALLHVLLCSGFIVLVFQNAWTGDDAYISFRSLEQLYAGNGPRWNSIDRVQVYTSPLWFWLLAFLRWFSSDVYVNAIAFSLLLNLILVIYCMRQLVKPVFAVLMLSALMLSNSFMDYTTSGLENPLMYLLLAVFVTHYYRAFAQPSRSSLAPLLMTAALLLVTRHDLLIIIFIPLLFFIMRNPLLLSLREKIKFVFFLLLPLALWTLFSLAYYGLPFPNTAYAKLHLNIPCLQLIDQGLFYFIYGIKHDIISIALLVAGIFFLATRIHNQPYQIIALSISCGCAYIIWIGGDFMAGRFYSHLVFVAVYCSVLNLKEQGTFKIKTLEWLGLALMALSAVYVFYYPHTPFDPPLDHPKMYFQKGVSDERLLYFSDACIWRYLDHSKPYFPDSYLADEGLKVKNTPVKNRKLPYEQVPNIGVKGYFMGLDTVIIDPYALPDMFRARLPRSCVSLGTDRTCCWAPGHTPHYNPPLYAESLIAKKPLMPDSSLNEYFAIISSINQSEKLFSLERFTQIVLLNLGYYEYLLNGTNQAISDSEPAEITNCAWGCSTEIKPQGCCQDTWKRYNWFFWLSPKLKLHTLTVMLKLWR